MIIMRCPGSLMMSHLLLRRIMRRWGRKSKSERETLHIVKFKELWIKLILTIIANNNIL